jgi:TIR domain/Sel1 repeat
MNGQIFISYRREESRWSARSLYDRLSAHFDRKQIFMDIDAIALGDDFVKAIEKTVGECDVLIAVIGAHWLTSKDEHDARRLDNAEDFVRREIATALKREIRVIPVLVDGALMPRSTELPDDLKPLIRRNALQVTDTGFDDDCRRLVDAIEQVLEENKAGWREREEKERREEKHRVTEPKERLEADRRQKEEQRRLEHKPHSPPVPGILILLAFGIGLAAVAVIYFGSRRPVLKPTISEVLTQPSVKPTAPVTVVTPNPAIIVTPSAEELAPRQDAVSPMVSSSPQRATPSPTPSEAERLAKTADAGDADAMYDLGLVYANGKGVAQDYGKAREWYQRAADVGKALAMNNLGDLYYYGKGVARDYGKAGEWYQKGADAGDANARQALAHLVAEELAPRQDAVSPMVSSSPQRATPSPTPSEAERLANALAPSPSPKLTKRSSLTPRPSATAVNPLSETSIRQFIERHLRSVENHNVDAYLSAYNDRVKWYGKGLVTMDYIRADIESFLHKWSDIRYEIVGSIQIDKLSEGAVRTRYPIKIRTRSEKKTGRNSEISGTEFVEIRVVNGLFKIFAENQEIVARS